MALGKSLGNILGDYFGEEVVTLNTPNTSLSHVQGKDTPIKEKSKSKKSNTIKSSDSAGLNSITPAPETVPKHDQQDRDENMIHSLKIDEIDVNEYQTREYFDEEKIEKLAQSIKSHGLIHPVLVLKRTNPPQGVNSYMLLAGERRLRAVKYLGKSEIMALVKSEQELSGVDQAMIAALENLQREDLSPIELAKTFDMLMELQKKNEEDLGEMLGYTGQYIRNYIRLLSLHPIVQGALREGTIGEGQARHLVGLPEERQLELLDIIITKDLTVKEVIQLIKEQGRDMKRAVQFVSRRHSIDPDLTKRFEQFAMKNFVNPKVKYTGSDEKGKIIISWG